ncbi:MAG: putative response-associated peptidase YoqW [Pseudomonadota bacterium]
MTTPQSEVVRLFRPVRAHDFPPRYNIAPTQPISIVRLDPVRQRELVLVRWGLVPGWVKKPDEFATILNARAETVAEKPSFRAALRHRRCLVPANGYYEWMGPPRAKQPYLLSPKDGQLFAFAGLWEHWLGADGSEFETAAILTVPASGAAATVHDRMPAILPPEAWDLWLDTRGADATLAMSIVQSAPDDLLEVRAVSKNLGNARNDDPSLIEPTQKTLL